MYDENGIRTYVDADNNPIDIGDIVTTGDEYKVIGLVRRSSCEATLYVRRLCDGYAGELDSIKVGIARKGSQTTAGV